MSVFMSQVTLLIAFICVRSAPWTGFSAYRYFEVVTICNFIMILAFYLVHLFRLYRMLTCISWPLSVREWPGPVLGGEVRIFAGPLRPHGVLPICPPHPLAPSLAPSALNFPLFGGHLCPTSRCCLKLTFHLQQGCCLSPPRSFSQVTDNGVCVCVRVFWEEHGRKKQIKMIGIYTVVNIG